MIKLFRKLIIINGLFISLVGNVYANTCDNDAFYDEFMADVYNYEKIIELAIPCTDDPYFGEIASSMVGEYYFFEGEEYTRDKEKLEKAFTLFEKSAEQGNDISLYYLGIMYLDGLHVRKDILIAKDYFEQSAELDNADAQVQLGIIYGDPGFIDTFFGKLPLDYEKALYWFKRAAENEYPDAVAAYNVHVMYFNGWGTDKNITVADEWLKLSAELGHPNAIVAGKKLDCAAIRLRAAADEFTNDAGSLTERQEEALKCDELYIEIN